MNCLEVATVVMLLPEPSGTPWELVVVVARGREVECLFCGWLLVLLCQIPFGASVHLQTLYGATPVVVFIKHPNCVSFICCGALDVKNSS